MRIRRFRAILGPALLAVPLGGCAYGDYGAGYGGLGGVHDGPMRMAHGGFGHGGFGRGGAGHGGAGGGAHGH